MVEHSQLGPQDPDPDSYGHDEATGASRQESQESYAFDRPATADRAGADYNKSGSVPLFLSDPDGEPDPGEFDYREFEAPRARLSTSSRILIAVVAAAGVAMMFAMATSDATRDIIVGARASIAGAPAAQAEATPQPDAVKLASDGPTKDPARWTAPAASQTTGIARGPAPTAPSREEISTAYQGVVQSRAAAPAAVAAPSARIIDADELALLMKRARDMLGAGDLPAARLLLRRAADAQDPAAALMLAQTYDPAVLGTDDARNVIPDPAAARAWYETAARLGSADAQRRLAQLQN
jgi:hypothetical protein